MTLRVSEIYLSVQGEGPRVGEPTIFVRFGGCNLRCAGWPCDTPHAIFPEQYRHEWKKMTYQEVFEEIKNVANGRLVNICYTGGEPFLQPGTDLEELTSALLAEDTADWVSEVECFSNGTLGYPLWASEQISFIMDWKLPGSGEDPYNKNRIHNLKERLTEKDAVKFVIKNKEDLELATELYQQYIEPLGEDMPEVFYGAVWGEIEDSKLIDWALEAKLPWRLNVQVHNHIYDRTQRGI